MSEHLKAPIIPLTSLSVRKARPDDYEDLCVLFADLDELHRLARPDLFRVPEGPPRSREYVAEFIACDTKAIFVALMGPKLVGFLTLARTDRPETPVRPARVHVEVDSISVAPNYRRRGIGFKLMQRAEIWAKAQGAPRLVLGVYAFNEGARQFYERAGFEVQSLVMAKSVGT